MEAEPGGTGPPGPPGPAGLGFEREINGDLRISNPDHEIIFDNTHSFHVLTDIFEVSAKEILDLGTNDGGLSITPIRTQLMHGASRLLLFEDGAVGFGNDNGELAVQPDGSVSIFGKDGLEPVTLSLDEATGDLHLDHAKEIFLKGHSFGAGTAKAGVSIDGDGNVVVSNENGALDLTNNGAFSAGNGNGSIRVTPEGKVKIAGENPADAAEVSVNADGDLQIDHGKEIRIRSRSFHVDTPGAGVINANADGSMFFGRNLLGSPFTGLKVDGQRSELLGPVVGIGNEHNKLMLEADGTMSVEQDTKVSNLNSDKLDDRDSSEFVLGISFEEFRNALLTPGTINSAGNPVDWSRLKGVPAGIADGVDDAGGGDDVPDGSITKQKLAPEVGVFDRNPATNALTGTGDLFRFTASSGSELKVNTEARLGTANGGFFADAAGLTGIGNAAGTLLVFTDGLGFWSGSQFAMNNNQAAQPTLLLQNANATGDALIAQGNVHVSRNLTVTGTKNFRIPHPLDAGKDLLHAANESPQPMNVYSGNVLTNRRGFAVVRLPAYFDAINRDFRYQLTSVGRNGWDARVGVWKEIAGNRFTIRSSKPHLKVSWQVTAVRDDAYMRANPFRAEQSRPKR